MYWKGRGRRLVSHLRNFAALYLRRVRTRYQEGFPLRSENLQPPLAGILAYGRPHGTP